jgi:transcriptional regulator with XRE-family HTH domain
MDKYADLKAFVRAEMDQRNMTTRAFAEFCGVSHMTIQRLSSETPDNRKNGPELASILKIAAATGRDITAVLAIAYPEEFRNDPLSPHARIMAQRLERLPEDVRRDVEKAINDALARHS